MTVNPQPLTRPSPADPPDHPRPPSLILLLHAGFILTGIVNTMLGPLLPIVSARWRLNDTQAGNLFFSQFLGSIVGVTASGVISPRRGSRFTLFLGLACMAAGSSGVGLVSWPLGIAAVFLWGIGLGLVIPTTNLLISEMYPRKRAAALNLINFSWGVGAMLSPLAVARLQQSDRSFWLLYGVAALLVILSIAILRRPFPAVDLTTHRSPQDFNRSNVWFDPAVPILGAVFFLYVGTEASVGGWIASYAKRSMPGAVSWAITPAFFWASLLFGRAVSPFVLRRLSETVLSRGGLSLAGMGLAGALMARNSMQLGISTCLIGLGLSPVFPVAIAAVSERFREAASRVAGLMFNLAGLGGASLPWLVGFTSTRANSLRIGLLIPLFGSILMLILNLLLAPKKQIGLLMTKKGPDNPALKA